MISLSSTQEQQRGAYSQLEQSLTAPEEELPTANATPMIEVIAPATLSEGYQFEAQYGESTFQVIVPPGGVEGGQKFMVPMPTSVTNNNGMPKINVPVGHWKDGLCDCFTYGPFHNHCVMAAFCPMIAAGQVIARLKLTFWGKPGTTQESAMAFQKILAFTAAYSFISIFLGIITAPYNNPDTSPEPSFFIIICMMIRSLLHYLYLGVLILVLWNLRAHVRAKYAIPEQEQCGGAGTLGGCEDLICSVCCAHCTAAQLMRHTTDYETYNATCCTETGLPPRVPSIV